MKNLFKLFAMFIVFSSVAFAQEDEGEETEIKEITIIHAGTLLAVAGNDPVQEKSIIIEDGKIKSVKDGYIDNDGTEDAEFTIIDMSDKFVMAGMMDMHVHLASGSGNSADYAIKGVINSYKTLMAGFTTVRDLGASDDTIFKLRKAINDGDVIGPRIYAAGNIIGVGGRTNGKECNGIESCRKTTRDMIRGGADWIKIYSSCSGSQLCSNEDGSPMFFDDEITAITEVAKKYNIKVAAHSHPRDSALQVLKYGVKSIEHGSFINEDAMDTMIADDVYYVPTVSVMDMLEEVVEKGEVSEEMLIHDQSFLDNNPPKIFEAYKRGVKIATGTDAGVVPHGKNYREVERFVELGIPNSDALKMTTVNAADLLDKSDEIGTIEVGKKADIIAIDGNPLETIEDIRNVVFVMKEGTVYKD
ncbi:amidohydrolase family protein [Pseudemcibacter aquimaris]|uniref:amidohydrolase family protein n=1 Tax=Pseudemcibacter aquimaris TaxID=2857064 RepID=UPI0020119AD9|nr:amidohydrolase family protein [Pseudemcibacter aquimaris]MCC3861056.1 amidohydrolase family protein [Pseudemcibacter aquimaris]WDU59874.1 amidohydrolase family protein [Pseudemcibacter aquimaris]